MKRLSPILVAVLFLIVSGVDHPTLGRGFGGFHGGGGGLAAGRAGGGLGAGGLGRGGGGPSTRGFAQGDLGIGQRGGGLNAGGLDAGRLGPAGAGQFGGSGFGQRGGALGNMNPDRAAPTRDQLGQFLGLPSDNGLHNLSGETQSRFSQAYDNIRAGEGPRQKNLSGETQSRLSQLYDEGRAGDLPQRNISGETQSRLSQLYDNIRAGDGPRQNFIHGETQNPLSRLYDDIRAGNHPFRPISPWIAHNNAVVIRNNFNNYNIYTPAWYRRYPAAWYPRTWAYGSAWVYAPWPKLWVWLGYPTGEPVYYDYGSNIVVQDNSVYVNGQDAGTTAEYAEQAQSLAEAGAAQQPMDDQQWMPLGVFALTRSGETEAANILQLAVNKQGMIRGNDTDATTNETEIVQGSVDKSTERAAWTIGSDSQTVYETGVYNLTKDQTPVLVHLGGGKTEQWLLVRLNSPDQKQQGASQ